VRIGSLEPTVIDAKAAVNLAKIKGVCPHFHLSLQSGCLRTLQAMGRSYTPEEFEAIVSGLREIDPLFGITTDVIVGFPGETETDFEESLSFVKHIEFSHVHVFKYSRRPGTKAADMPDQVSEEEKNRRSKLMIEVAGVGAKSFLAKNMDKRRRLLILDTEKKTQKTGLNVRGLTDNGIDVRFVADQGEYEQNKFYNISLKREMAFFVE
jgi:threonylcarbamoyladenosine tRNA methylthiotransferase MtaB